jgi:monomeric sarcosine oxidase
VARYVVIGGGGIGSAAAYWLSRRAGDEVVCLEQFQLGHELGASEDHSRIIRHSYHSPVYTALTGHAYAAWREVEAESGLPLVHATGMLNLAPRESVGTRFLDACAASMDAFGIGHERLGADEVMRRWPQFRLPADLEALFHPEGGILDIRRAGAVLRALARGRGATVIGDAQVTAIRPGESGVRVESAAGDFEAERVVVCTGAWTRELLRGLGHDWPIRLTHEQVTYFQTSNLAAFAPSRFPVWVWHGDGDDEYYGFPVYGEVATKAAQDLGGRETSLDGWPAAPDAERVARVARFCEEILPGYTGPELRTRSCLYDMPPDRDFVVDLLPGEPRIAVCVGAGHAAKFAALLGRILSELVVDGATGFPIDAFRADRPALVDPGFRPDYRLGGVASTGAAP